MPFRSLNSMPLIVNAYLIVETLNVWLFLLSQSTASILDDGLA